MKPCGSCTTPIIRTDQGLIHFWNLSKRCFPEEPGTEQDVAVVMVRHKYKLPVGASNVRTTQD